MMRDSTLEVQVCLLTAEPNNIEYHHLTVSGAHMVDKYSVVLYVVVMVGHMMKECRLDITSKTREKKVRDESMKILCFVVAPKIELSNKAFSLWNRTFSRALCMTGMYTLLSMCTSPAPVLKLVL